MEFLGDLPEDTIAFYFERKWPKHDWIEYLERQNHKNEKHPLILSKEWWEEEE